jgi:RNA polymerase sigma-70 factor (ECF subfamily)
VPFEVPARDAWLERLEAVLATLEIAYAQAYEDAALAGDAAGFAGEVLRLSAILAELASDEPEVTGGLALPVRFAEGQAAGSAGRTPRQWCPSGRNQPGRGAWRRDTIEEGGAPPRPPNANLPPPRTPADHGDIHAAHLIRAEGRPTPWRTSLRCMTS